MKLFEMKKTTTYTIIIGCGRLGANLANTLSSDGENVLIMDANESAFKCLDANFGGLSVAGNGTDLDKLREAEIEKATSVVAVTNDDNTNIMIAQIARDLFGVRRVIARLYDPQRESVYQELGIATICPSILSIKEIEKQLSKSANEEALS